MTITKVNRMNFRMTAAAAAVVLAATGLSACATGSTEETTDETAAAGLTKAEAGAFPTTIKHALGETTIEEEPKRVVALGWSDADVALSLGVVPVGASKHTWGATEEGSTVWFDEALAEIDGAEAPTRIDDTSNGVEGAVADIAKLQPDLIIATNYGMTKAQYKKLSKLGVPVVAQPGEDYMATWRESLDIIGQALGRNKVADEVEAETEAAFEAAKEEHPDLVGKSHFVTWIDPKDTSEVGVYGDIRATVLEEIGMTVPEWASKITNGTAWGTVSSERAATLDADLVIAMAESQDEVDTLSSDKLLAKIPAFAAGDVWWDLPPHEMGFALDSATPISLPYMIEHLLPELEKTLEDK